jgi:hypothetical protein
MRVTLETFRIQKYQAMLKRIANGVSSLLGDCVMVNLNP